MLEEDCAAILRSERPLIDVRAPAEFARGAVPGAVSLPLLSDDERAEVGKAYKRHGRESAVALGHRLVAGQARAQRLAAWKTFAAAHPDALVMCWRGGLRSQIVQQWLAEAGIRAGRVGGGFKALRQACIDVLERSGERRFVLVGGRTGSGKTELVRKAGLHIDLEALANHRGSAFGPLPTPQPAPVNFENALAVALLKLPVDATVALEDESRSIGRLAIPAPLFEAMQRAPIAVLEVDEARRVDNILREYVLDARQPHERLPEQLARIERRLGPQRHGEVAALMRNAFAAEAGEAEELHRLWIRRLLRYYYDPMYDYQMRRKAARIAMRGSQAEVAAYLVASGRP